jgi:hypothetical protein
VNFQFFPVTSNRKRKWEQIYPGIWKATAGKPASISLLQAADVKANLDALDKLPVTTFPLPAEKIDVKTINQ